ncbi:hypothetical protein NFI96_015826, partial [Prochilodus magdalenae]
MAASPAAKASSKLCLFVHVVFFAWYVFTLRANCSIEISDRHPGTRSYGGRWKYLTFINLVMQTVFFGFCVLTDVVYNVLPSKSTRGGIPLFLVTLRDGFFTVLAFPVGTFVFASFWSLYTYDRELVYPKYLDDIIPIWLNHAMHTVIMPLLLAQMYLQPHKTSQSPGMCISRLGLRCLLRCIWPGMAFPMVRHVSGLWVYPTSWLSLSLSRRLGTVPGGCFCQHGSPLPTGRKAQSCNLEHN